jgi:hypothetical protein
MEIQQIEKIIESLDFKSIEHLKAELFPEIWKPFAGKPQEAAYYSLADYLFYGGAAGGGKTSLLIGLALTQHWKSIIFRREYTQIVHIEEEIIGILDNARVNYQYNGQKKIFRLADGRTVELGAVQHAKDVKKWQGRPHDYVGFDEATHFTAHMVRFLCGWLRTDRLGQRCRVVCASNPPEDVDGRWVIDYWAPWLDAKHPDPAAPGELRWYVVDSQGHEHSVADHQPALINGEWLTPKSRSFIPAYVQDNPIYMSTGYLGQLQAYEEPLRSIYLMGDFRASVQDDPWQVVPTAWVDAAMARWKVTPCPSNIPRTAIGVDVARGGRDQTVLISRWANWFGPFSCHQGKSTPTGQHVVALIAPLVEDARTTVCVDVIGIGASVVDQLMDEEAKSGEALIVLPLNGAGKSVARDKSGKFGFINKRAEWYWRFREALDPTSGQDLCLPPDPQLLQELTSPTFSVTLTGIKIESKEDIKERLGRSPDKADSIIYCSVVPEYNPEMYFALEELEASSSPWEIS